MNILLVDDNPEYLELIKDALCDAGNTVFEAEDGIKGCEILTREPIDLIISDIKMPKFDGIMLHNFTREMDEHKHTRFVFLSGHAEHYAGLLSLDPGIDYVVDKVTTADEIVSFVEGIMADLETCTRSWNQRDAGDQE